jgi:hypothetical protein
VTRKIHTERPCGVCGKLFIPKHGTERLCSALCRKERAHQEYLRDRSRKQHHALIPSTKFMISEERSNTIMFTDTTAILKYDYLPILTPNHCRLCGKTYRWGSGIDGVCTPCRMNRRDDVERDKNILRI